MPSSSSQPFISTHIFLAIKSAFNKPPLVNNLAENFGFLRDLYASKIFFKPPASSSEMLTSVSISADSTKSLEKLGAIISTCATRLPEASQRVTYALTWRDVVEYFAKSPFLEVFASPTIISSSLNEIRMSALSLAVLISRRKSSSTIRPSSSNIALVTSSNLTPISASAYRASTILTDQRQLTWRVVVILLV